MSQKTTLKLSNLQIFIASKALEKLKLTGQPSFARRRFLRDLKFYIGDVEAERKELLHKYVEKKGDELKLDGNEYVFTAYNRKQYNKEFDKLNDIEVEIDITDANAKDFITVSQVLLDEANRLEKENAEGVDADTFDYIEYLKEISAILNYVK